MAEWKQGLGKIPWAHFCGKCWPKLGEGYEWQIVVTTLWIIPIRLIWTTRTERIRTLMYDGSLIGWSFGNSLTARVVRSASTTMSWTVIPPSGWPKGDRSCFPVPGADNYLSGNLKKVCRDSLRRLHHRRVSHGNLSSLIRAVFIFYRLTRWKLGKIYIESLLETSNTGKHYVLITGAPRMPVFNLTSSRMV